MSRIIHLVRHAQGFHNLSEANHSLRDPLLTDFGKEQCAELAKVFPYTSQMKAIVASPLKRTIHTALETFPTTIAEQNLRVIALPEIQESTDLPCDTGSPIAELKREFSELPVDISLVEEAGDNWCSKEGPWAPSADMIDGRARKARQWLRELSERVEGDVVVVTHGGFLHYLTEDWHEAEKFMGTGWVNTEFRSYTFDPNGGANASLLETAESRIRRIGHEHPLSEEEQRNLREITHRSWQELGYQKESVLAKM